MNHDVGRAQFGSSDDAGVAVLVRDAVVVVILVKTSDNAAVELMLVGKERADGRRRLVLLNVNVNDRGLLVQGCTTTETGKAGTRDRDKGQGQGTRDRWLVMQR
jgi:hypothetical protein